MPKLLIKTGEQKGKTYPIRDRVVFIGRDPSNAITLPDKQVSRKHASISPHGSEFIIEDLGSANGTMVNNHPVHRQVLRPGDKITLGSTILEFTPLLESDEIPGDLNTMHLGGSSRPPTMTRGTGQPSNSPSLRRDLNLWSLSRIRQSFQLCTKPTSGWPLCTG